MKLNNKIILLIIFISTCYPVELYVGGSKSIRPIKYENREITGCKYFNSFVLGIEKELYKVTDSYQIFCTLYLVNKGISGERIISDNSGNVVGTFSGENFTTYLSTAIIIKTKIPQLIPDLSFFIGPRFDYALNHVEQKSSVEYNPETGGIMGQNFNNTDIGYDVGIELSKGNLSFKYIYSGNISKSYSTKLIEIRNVTHQFLVGVKLQKNN